MELSPTTHNLATRINLQLLKLYRLQSTIRHLQTDIESFLQDYFSALEKQLRPFFSSAQQALPLMQETPQAEFISHLQSMEQLLKQIYRQLAKHYHPDTGSHANHATMAQINDAYAQKELGSLMLLYQAIMPADSITYSHQDLVHYQQMISALTTQAEQALAELEHSEANRLRKQIFVARLHGVNAMEEIAAKLQKIYRQQPVFV